jgi:hypothetical protein
VVDGGYLHLVYAIAKCAKCAYAVMMWPRSLRGSKDLSCCMRMSDVLTTCDAASSVSRIPGTTSASRVVAVGNVGRVAWLLTQST